jgi:hypothetical protein
MLRPGKCNVDVNIVRVAWDGPVGKRNRAAECMNHITFKQSSMNRDDFVGQKFIHNKGRLRRGQG